MMKKFKYIEKYYIVRIAFLFLTILSASRVSVTASAAEADNRIHNFTFSNDPFAVAQWYIDNQGQYSDMSEIMMRQEESTLGIDMDVVEAWNSMAEAGVPDREVVVAVIDTGVDYKHPDLADNMWVNPGEIPGDNIDNDNNGYIDDVYGWDFYNSDATVCHYSYSEDFNRYTTSQEDNDNHGTHVAGVIAAVANNNIGIAGIASNINVKIMSLKINGGPNGSGDAANAIAAIRYATMMGADICNLSWGTQVYSAGLEEAMRESDMLFIAAAGNTGTNNDIKPIYPANLTLDNMISVTFIDADGNLTGYSNFGLTTVDLAAPGDKIYSTIVGSYDTMSGSSMAAPQVTAIAAMLYAYNDHLYASNIKNIILNNIKKLNGLDGLLAYGGIPSAYQAVVASGSLAQDIGAPVMTFDTIFNKDGMTVPVSVEDTGASMVRVVKYIFGEKKVEDFLHGTNGTTVENGQVNISKAGTYTFYASDYAGNETAQIYEVTEDTTAPKVTASYTVASNYKSRTVTILVSDDQSGIKRIKYMAGVKSPEAFLPADTGTKILLKNGKAKFKVKKDGVYTIFASDNRGNIITKTILIKTVRSTSFKLVTQDKTLAVGDQYVLRTSIKPAGCTDKITYTSSNEEIAIVSSTGKVTALAEGKAYITATTDSGLSSACLITVRLKT